MSKEGIAYELHKPARKTFTRRKVISKGLYDVYQSDLIDMSSYSRENKGYRYIVILIDVYSKYAWARPLKSKTGKDVAAAIDNILMNLKRVPKFIHTDKGTEYYNYNFKDLLKKYNMKHYSVHSTMKACIAERFIRTLKTNMFREFSSRGSYAWLNILQPLIDKYNNTMHSTIKMKPKDVADNSLLLSTYCQRNICSKKPKFKPGHFVRVSKHKTAFRKGYLPNWSTEIFKVDRVQPTCPATFLLQDLKGNPIVGAFYEEELQRTKYPDIYLVEKILRRKGPKVYVKWLGFPNTENSWISESQLLDNNNTSS